MLLNNSKLNALISAFAASLCVRVFEFSIHVLGDHQINPLREVKFSFIAVASYLAVALLLHQFWMGRLKRMLPIWLLIAFWGSLLYESIMLVPMLIHLWNDPYRTEPNLFRIILTEFDFTRTTFTLNFLVALPVMAVFYYADTIIKAWENWHNHTQDSPSILSKPTLKK